MGIATPRPASPDHPPASSAVRRRRPRLGILLAAGLLAGCAAQPGGAPSKGSTTPDPTPAPETAAPAPARTGPATVALLVPLSGAQGATGARLEAAARRTLTPERAAVLRLTVHDTAGTPAGARAAADAALAGGADLVLGPLFSVSAQAVAPTLAAAGIPALSFSNNRAVAGNGIYLLGHLPGQQTADLLTYAASQGHGQVAIVGPDTAYARQVASAARDAAGQGRIRLLDSRLFPPNTRYDGQVQIVRELARSSLTAAVIPTSGLSLVGLSALFDYYNATAPRVRLLGTDLWEWPGTFAESSLRRAWYVTTSTPPRQGGRLTPSRPEDPAAGPDDAASAEATPVPSARPETMAGDPSPDGDGADTGAGDAPVAPPTAGSKPSQPERPPEPEPAPIQLAVGPDKLERLAMDAVALAAAWARDGRTDDTFLVDPAGFQGFSGLFRLLPNGLNERGLHVMEVHADGPRIVRPAPARFTPGQTPRRIVMPSDFTRHPWLTTEFGASAPAAPAAPSPASWPTTNREAAPPAISAPAAPAPAGAAAPACQWVQTCEDGPCRRVQRCAPTS